MAGTDVIAVGDVAPSSSAFITPVTLKPPSVVSMPVSAADWHFLLAQVINFINKLSVFAALDNEARNFDCRKGGGGHSTFEKHVEW